MIDLYQGDCLDEMDIACQHLGRNFIGIEKDPGYFEAAKKRIEEATKQ